MAELGTTTVCAGRNNRSVNPQQQDVGKINEFVVWGVWKMLCRSEPGRGRTIRKCLRLSSAKPSAPDLGRRWPHFRKVPECMARPCGARWRSERANVRAASMYSASEVERLRSAPRWVSARIQGWLAEKPRGVILAPSLLVAPGRPFVHLLIPSRRPRWEPRLPQPLMFDVRGPTLSHPLGATVARSPLWRATVVERGWRLSPWWTRARVYD